MVRDGRDERSLYIDVWARDVELNCFDTYVRDFSHVFHQITTKVEDKFDRQVQITFNGNNGFSMKLK